MAKVIHKYGIPMPDPHKLLLPRGHRILHMGVQHDQIFIWALVDPYETTGDLYEVCILGTGHNISEDPGEYFGTAMTHGGQLVWHVFGKKI